MVYVRYDGRPFPELRLLKQLLPILNVLGPSRKTRLVVGSQKGVSLGPTIFSPFIY